MHFNFPSTTTAILSANASASSIACVVRIIVLSLFKSYIRDQTSLLDTGSMPVVGSSENIIFGFPITLIATDNLLFIPPEKEPT